MCIKIWIPLYFFLIKESGNIRQHIYACLILTVLFSKLEALVKYLKQSNILNIYLNIIVKKTIVLLKTIMNINKLLLFVKI